MEVDCENQSYTSINISDLFGISSLNADHDTAYVIRGWLSAIVGVFGLIGNALSAIVLTRQTLRALPINVILLFLSVCDTIYILLYLVSWSLPTILGRMAMEEEDTIMLNNYFLTHWRQRFYPYLYPLLWTGSQNYNYY